MGKRSVAAAVVAIIAVLVMGLAPAGAKTSAIRVDFKKQAVLSGDVVLLTVQTRCPAGATVLETLAYVTQDGFTSQFSSIPLTCDGRKHTRVVTIRAFEEAPFETGAARATTFALVLLPGGVRTIQGGDTGPIRIR